MTSYNSARSWYMKTGESLCLHIVSFQDRMVLLSQFPQNKALGIFVIILGMTEDGIDLLQSYVNMVR